MGLPCWVNAGAGFFTPRPLTTPGVLLQHWAHSGFWNSAGKTRPGFCYPGFTSLHQRLPLILPSLYGLLSPYCSLLSHAELNLGQGPRSPSRQMGPCDGLGQRALGSGEAVGIFQVAEDHELSLIPGTLCVPCESWSSASQETPTFDARPVLTLTSSCVPLLTCFGYPALL